MMVTKPTTRLLCFGLAAVCVLANNSVQSVMPSGTYLLIVNPPVRWPAVIFRGDNGCRRLLSAPPPLSRRKTSRVMLLIAL